MKLRYLSALAGLVVAAATAPAMAQQPGTPMLLRGTVDGVDGNSMAITTREGEKLTLTLSDETRIAYNTQKTMADIAEGVQLGVTTIDGPDGKPKALEVHIMDQTPGVHRPWDLVPDSTMTNGTVTSAADQDGNRVFTVHYKTDQGEGDWEVVVTPDTPVVHMVNDGDRSLLVAGAYVFVSARKLDDGTYTAGFVMAEKDGVKPPL